MIDVLTKKGEALCNLLALKQNVSSSDDKELKGKLEELYEELQRWVDPIQEAKTAPFTEKYLTSHQLYGSLAKLLHKVQEEKPTVETERKLIEVRICNSLRGPESRCERSGASFPNSCALFFRRTKNSTGSTVLRIRSGVCS